MQDMPAQKPKIVYWKAGGVVRAKQVYLDANFLVALSSPEHIWHANACGLLEALQQREIMLVLSSLALNEAIYQLLSLERKRDKNQAVLEVELEEENPGQDNRASDIQVLPWYDRLNEEVLKLPGLKTFEPPDPSFHRQTIKNVADLGLDPTDAFHYAATRALVCPLVSNDAGFQKIPDQNLTIVTFY